MTTFTLSEKKQSLYSDYCQFLLASFTNFTQTYFADHTDEWSHDQLNRFLRNENIPSSELWESVEPDIEFDKDGYIIFDDVVLSKIYSQLIEAVYPQWSGSDKKVIKGIGIVTCVYVNPKTHEYWVIDYRIFDKAHDGKTKNRSFTGYVARCLLQETTPVSDSANGFLVCIHESDESD